jgi:peptidoglycan/LPS O-acetylase OafA/YrhL
MTSATLGTGNSINSNRHLPTLDGLRGIAIALVLGHSLTLLESIHSVRAYLLNFSLSVGWVGVQLFFVLSGFLITGILLDTKQSPNYFKSFFGRRALRIFPLYFGTLIIAFVVLPWMGDLPASFQQDYEHQTWFWFYLSNWYSGDIQGFPHYWSLAVEEQFYLLWPFLVYRLSPKSLLKLCIGLAIASLAIRIGLRFAGEPEGILYTTSFCRMDALALGAAVAVLLRNPVWLERLRTRATTLILCAVAVLLPTAVITRGFERTSFLGQTLGYSALSVAFALVIMAAALADTQSVTAWWRTILASRPLRIMGKYSYAMYMFQRPLHKLVGIPVLHWLAIDPSDSPGWDLAYVLVMSLLTLGVAMLSYRLIEGPILKLKDRFIAAPPVAEPVQVVRAPVS